MRILSRSQVLGANDLVFEDVLTPEWAPSTNEDGTPTTPEQRAECGVRIRNLTGEGRSVFIQRSLEIELQKKAAEQAVKDGRSVVNVPRKFDIEMLLVAMTAVDEAGALVFTEDDVTELGKKNAAAIARCATAAQRLSGLSTEAKEQAVKS